MTYLKDSESSEANRKSASPNFMPQDHYVHIVNLYILGIYIFFYHQTLNRDLTRHFVNQRPERTIDRKLPSVKDFISSWKYFCLYHDVAYPVELAFQIDPEDKDKSKFKISSDDRADLVTPFNYIEDLFLKETVVEAVAKLLLLKELLDDNRYIRSLKNCFDGLDFGFINSRKQPLNIQEFIEKYGEYICFEKLFCYDDIKMLINKNNQAAVLTVLYDI